MKISYSKRILIPGFHIIQATTSIVIAKIAPITVHNRSVYLLSC
jgi:hypothetical protein